MLLFPDSNSFSILQNSFFVIPTGFFRIKSVTSLANWFISIKQWDSLTETYFRTYVAAASIRSFEYSLIPEANANLSTFLKPNPSICSINQYGFFLISSNLSILPVHADMILST